MCYQMDLVVMFELINTTYILLKFNNKTIEKITRSEMLVWPVSELDTLKSKLIITVMQNR